MIEKRIVLFIVQPKTGAKFIKENKRGGEHTPPLEKVNYQMGLFLLSSDKCLVSVDISFYQVNTSWNT